MGAIDLYDSLRDFSGKPFKAACYAPWTSMVFDSIGRVRVCCVNFDHVLGDIRTERIDDIWSGPRIRKLRDALRNYEFHLGCRGCQWRIEMGGLEQRSLRETSLIPLKYEEFTIESDGQFWPKHLEFHLSNKCNLECVTCYGEFSSLIRQRRENLPPIAPAYSDQFFDDLAKYLPRLQEAQFLGGEPFLMRESYRVWDMMIENHLAPRIHITTNGTVYSDKVERVLNRLPASISVSIDGATAGTFESIRVNAKFARVIENLRRFRSLCQKHGTTIGVHFTLARLNVHELVDMARFLDHEDVRLNIIDLHEPKDLSLFSLPAAELAPIVARLEKQAAKELGPESKNSSVLHYHLELLRRQLSAANTGYGNEFHAAERPAIVEELIREDWGTSHTTEEQCRTMLEQWAGAGDIDSLVLDHADVIQQASLSSTSLLGTAPLEGTKWSELWPQEWKKRLGEHLVMISESRSQRRLDRLFLFQNLGEPGCELRYIAIPLRDAAGDITRAKIFVAAVPRKHPTIVEDLRELDRNGEPRTAEQCRLLLREWSGTNEVDVLVVNESDVIQQTVLGAQSPLEGVALEGEKLAEAVFAALKRRLGDQCVMTADVRSHRSLDRVFVFQEPPGPARTLRCIAIPRCREGEEIVEAELFVALTARPTSLPVLN